MSSCEYAVYCIAQELFSFVVSIFFPLFMFSSFFSKYLEKAVNHYSR